MKLFQRAQRSLFGEILDWMLTPLLLLVPVSIGVTWLVAQGIANAPFDRALESNIQTLAQLVDGQTAAGSSSYLPQPAREILRGDDVDRVYYQVLDGHGGDFSAASADIPFPGTDDAAGPWRGATCAASEIHGRPCAWHTLWVAGGRPDTPWRWCRWPRHARSSRCSPPKSSRA